MGNGSTGPQREPPQGYRCNASSDSEGDEAVVTLDVSFQDFRAGAEDAFETRPVQLHTLERTPGHHSGCTGSVQQQCNLPWREERRKSRYRMGFLPVG